MNFCRLFMEYETQLTKEATLVKDLDRFDMICQAYEYEESRRKPHMLQEFFDATEGKFKHPNVQRWVAELKEKRASFESSIAAGQDSKE